MFALSIFIYLPTKFHQCSLAHPFSPILRMFTYAARIFCTYAHPLSLVFLLVFHKVCNFLHLHDFCSPIFTYSHYFHLFSPISPISYFHLFSPIFTYFHLFSPIFIYFHLFSPIFTYFHLFSPIFTHFHLFSPIFTQEVFLMS